jgi:hypothetical protein
MTHYKLHMDLFSQTSFQGLEDFHSTVHETFVAGHACGGEDM